MGHMGQASTKLLNCILGGSLSWWDQHTVNRLSTVLSLGGPREIIVWPARLQIAKLLLIPENNSRKLDQVSGT